MVVVLTDERPATRGGLCCVCHAAPRYRRNAQTCRAAACRAAWSRQRNVFKNRTYRLQKADPAMGVLVEDPALLVELAERTRRSVRVSGNPVTGKPQNPVTPLYGIKPIILNTKDNTTGQKYVTALNRYSSETAYSSGVEYSSAENLFHQGRYILIPDKYPDKINHHPLIQDEIVPDSSTLAFTLLRATGKLDTPPCDKTAIAPDAVYCRTDYGADVPPGCVWYQERQGIVDYDSVLVEGRTVPDLLANLRPYLWRLVAGCSDDSPQLLRLFLCVVWVKEQAIFLALQPSDVALIREAAIVLDREATRVKSGGSSQILRGMPLEHVSAYHEAAAILRRAALAKTCGSVFASDPGYGLAPGLALVQSLLAELEPASVRVDAAVPLPNSQPAQTPDEPRQSSVVAAFTTFGRVMRRPDLEISPGPESMCATAAPSDSQHVIQQPTCADDVWLGIAARASPEMVSMPTGPPRSAQADIYRTMIRKMWRQRSKDEHRRESGRMNLEQRRRTAKMNRAHGRRIVADRGDAEGQVGMTDQERMAPAMDALMIAAIPFADTDPQALMGALVFVCANLLTSFGAATKNSQMTEWFFGVVDDWIKSMQDALTTYGPTLGCEPAEKEAFDGRSICRPQLDRDDETLLAEMKTRAETLVEVLGALPGIHVWSWDVPAACEFVINIDVDPSDAGWWGLDFITWAVGEIDMRFAEDREDAPHRFFLGAWHNSRPDGVWEPGGLQFQIYGDSNVRPVELAALTTLLSSMRNRVHAHLSQGTPYSDLMQDPQADQKREAVETQCRGEDTRFQKIEEQLGSIPPTATDGGAPH